LCVAFRAPSEILGRHVQAVREVDQCLDEGVGVGFLGDAHVRQGADLAERELLRMHRGNGGAKIGPRCARLRGRVHRQTANLARHRLARAEPGVEVGDESRELRGEQTLCLRAPAGLGG
jgi:hypothetical protein